ncbi:hypothetical protein CA13_24890 [Planctomycetes bacterium CA13]|uniref:Uncharacterized protein n=1 Tax=Novipirellula herctigrandis TaxID=2527986 RepID=A0A5C5Z0Y4_9BACT|nr:hypothetical protein CA13_24890 [Planctomycetes bacterium CA13]
MIRVASERLRPPPLPVKGYACQSSKVCIVLCRDDDLREKLMLGKICLVCCRGAKPVSVTHPGCKPMTFVALMI